MLSSRPLAQFQSAKYDREDILAMLKSINRRQEPGVRLSPEKLLHNFSRCWPWLKAKLNYIRNSDATGGSAKPAQTGEPQIVEAIKPCLSDHSEQHVTNPSRSSERGESPASPEPTVRPRRRGVSSLRPPISKRWDETVRPRIPGVSSLRPPISKRWAAV
jgi:hypothetical protein